MTDNSPQLGGQSDVTGREPELSGSRRHRSIFQDFPITVLTPAIAARLTPTEVSHFKTYGWVIVDRSKDHE